MNRILPCPNCGQYIESDDTQQRAAYDRGRRDESGVRDERQRRIARWCADISSPEEANSLPQRGLRLAEEAIETAQACGLSADQVHRLVDYVYGRPVGELHQELGGVGVTLLLLAQAASLSAEAEEIREVERVLAKPLEHFRKRNSEKNAAGLTAMKGEGHGD